MKVTLGGDRLGSGKKSDLALHNYYRSTHNLSQKFTSPMTVGALYPFLVIPTMRGDKFEIELKADCITVPTTGPLFGSFKMQVDVFECPVRLYQAILHNNPTNIGLKMNQVLLPTFTLHVPEGLTTLTTENYKITAPFNNSCLWKYLGMSGLGKFKRQGHTPQQGFSRSVNAVPLLAYYDIFKNYYANKQEENAYYIQQNFEDGRFIQYNNGVIIEQNLSETSIEEFPQSTNYTTLLLENLPNWDTNGNQTYKIQMNFSSDFEESEIVEIVDKTPLQIITEDTTYTVTFLEMAREFLQNRGRKVYAEQSDNYISIVIPQVTSGQIWQKEDIYYHGSKVIGFGLPKTIFQPNEKMTFGLQPFPLKNIDDMRMDILSSHTLGEAFSVTAHQKLPYTANNNENLFTPLNGLVIKTYQSDIYNNWINTEWIDGENGIAEITKVATSDGAFKIDALLLAEKLYNMLNRIAVTGGTYDDWLDAVYGEEGLKHWETPKYLGGMSSEIVFEQIVSTAATEDQPLGDLAGRGRHVKRKGGKVICKCSEPSYIIGIVSITPRINYNQGNEFYLTEIKSLDDMHKPALDGIGFQNLIGERLAYWDTTYDNRTGVNPTRSTIGKIPAWLEYMTAVDKTFGDFAEQDGKAFMCLNRNYEMNEQGQIKDATTYIDPTKYNYAFANDALDAQNFWVQIQSFITARRKMSAKQIPNI